MLYQIVKLIKKLSSRELYALYGAIAVFIVSGTILAGVVFVQKTVEIPVPGGEWREGIVGQPTFVNPVVSGNDADRDISKLVFADLRTLGEIKQENNSKEWVVRLNEDLRWQDGTKITSDDVIFTVETILNPESHSPLYQSFEGVLVSRVSELETKFTLPAPYVFFETTLKNLELIPKHIFGNIPASNFRLSNYVLEPVASGPYVFDSYKKDKNGFIEEYRLKVNPNYYPMPYISRFIFKFFTSEAEAVNAYNADAIDGIMVSDPDNLAKIQVRHSIERLSAPRYYAIFINQSLTAALRDVKARAALDQAIDKQKLIQDIFGGFAVPLEGPTPEAKPTAIEGKIADAPSFNLTVADIPVLIKTAEAVKSDWAKIGVQTNIVPLNITEISESIKKRDYQMILFGNILNNPEDFYSFWHSSKRFYPGLNLALYQNSRADGLIERIRAELDPSQRLVDVAKLSDLIASDYPAIFLYAPDYLYITSPKLKGFETTSVITPTDRLGNAGSWYIKTTRKLK
ncbi:MAG: ABC transporter substrate-binding protein [Patescibacteria group bacterium]|nr:ABC transporter substrate-binding protein [Patescibacteria group bacterium]MCL5261794.1 ABC transporter substrate-binding protein [Patescibacteria group bacterium]